MIREYEGQVGTSAVSKKLKFRGDDKNVFVPLFMILDRTGRSKSLPLHWTSVLAWHLYLGNGMRVFLLWNHPSPVFSPGGLKEADSIPIRKRTSLDLA